MHFPPPDAPLDQLNAFRSPAHRRLIFEEFFLFQLGIVQRRRRADTERKPRPVVVTDATREAVRRVLPFKLTGDQKTAIREIVTDMQRPQPMNRLLQGDVGAGKTIVALMASLVAMENGLQVAFMAPTEILAEQHFFNIRRLLEQSRFRIALLTGATPARKRRELLAELAGGSLQMVIGTHALVQEDVAFRELGLAVIDEQHRFGVLQRATLRAKGLHPDVLVMTATPIPRTLALTTYGDLDVSVMREMPPGRKPIATTARPESRRDDVYAFVREQLEQGRQTYIIYPLVEESEKIDLKAATEMADHLSQDVFPEYRVALLHGRMKQDAKDRVMGGFVRGEFHILVSTTVVEVGRGRGERDRDGGGARGALRAVAAPSAPRPRRPQPAQVVLHLVVPVAALRAGARAAEGADGYDRRIRDRGARSRTCAVPATSSARASQVCRRCGSAISCAITR